MCPRFNDMSSPAFALVQDMETVERFEEEVLAVAEKGDSQFPQNILTVKYAYLWANVVRFPPDLSVPCKQKR